MEDDLSKEDIVRRDVCSISRADEQQFAICLFLQSDEFKNDAYLAFSMLADGGYHNRPVLMSAAIPPYNISCRGSYSFAIDPSGAVVVIHRQLAVQSDATLSYWEFLGGKRSFLECI